MEKSQTNEKLPDLDQVITGAQHCLAGKYCHIGCPYYSKRKKKCDGDFRKDLLRWVLYLREQAGF